MRIECFAAVPEADRAALLDLWIAAWTATMPELDFPARRGWLSEHLDALLRGDAVLLVIRADGTPQGFLTLHPDTGEIDQLAVGPARSGRGLGRALMDTAKAMRPSGLILKVNQANRRAIRFYQAAGFKVTGEELNERSGLPVFRMAWPGPP